MDFRGPPNNYQFEVYCVRRTKFPVGMGPVNPGIDYYKPPFLKAVAPAAKCLLNFGHIIKPMAKICQALF